MSSELRKLWEHAGGQLPDDWAIVSLESLLRDSKSIAVGVMYPGPDTPGGVPLLKVGDVKDGSVPIKPSYCISAETDEEHKRTKLVGDELLITLVGNPGECVVVTPEMAGWNPARAIAVVRLHDTSLRTYLKTVLESTAGRHLIDSVLNTTVQKTLNLKDIRKLPIPLPSSATIQSVSRFSEALTMRITLLRETNATLEAIAQALFKSWFVDFDPVRAKAEGRQPEGMGAPTAALFPDSFEESEMGLVPKGWGVVRLGDVTERITKGTTPTTLKRPFVESGINFVKVESITDDGQLLPEKFAYIDDETHGLLGRSQLKADDVLITIAGTIGRVAVVTDDFIPANTNQAVAIVRPDTSKLPSAFVNQFLRLADSKSRMGERVVQAVQANLSLGSLSDMKLVMPPSELVTKLHDLVFDSVGSKRNSNQQCIRTLTQLRDTLLPRLISGQLRLPEAEALIEEVR